MKRHFRRLALAACGTLLLAACGDRHTRETIRKAGDLAQQKQYQEANALLIDALRAREAQVRAGANPATQAESDALLRKVQSDPQILEMERAQLPLYLALERADLASAVESDILKGKADDRAIFDLTHNPDAVVRTGAARVLGLLNPPGAVDALAAAARDPDNNVRRAAVAALGSLRDPRCVPLLIEALKDSYWFTRSDAADALGRAGDPRAVRPLLDLVADSDKTVENAAENALLALCAAPGPAPDDFAARLTDPNPKIAQIAAVCLALLKDPRAVPELLKMAAESDATTRLHAVRAMGETGDPAVLPALRAALKDPEINVRGWSIISLGKLKDQASIPALNAIAADPNESPNVRAAAGASVRHITGADAGAGAAAATQ